MCQHWTPRVAPLDSMSPVVVQMCKYVEHWATPSLVAEGRSAALKMLERQRKAQQEKVDKQQQRFQKGIGVMGKKNFEQMVKEAGILPGEEGED